MQSTNDSMTDTAKWLYTVPGKKKSYILALVIVQALHGASGVLYALLLRNIVDAAVNSDTAGFWRAVIFTIILVLSQIALRAIIRYLTELSKSTFENLFKARLMDNILHRDFASVSAVHSGEWLNRLTNDTTVVADSYVDILPGLAGMVVKLISAIAMMIALDPIFAAIIIPGGIIIIIFTYVFRKILKRLHKSMQEKDGHLRIFLQERIGSLMMIRSYAAEDQVKQGAEDKMHIHKDARMKRNRFSNFANIGFSAALNGMYLFAVCYCGYGILTARITYGTLTAITQLVSQIQAPFTNLTGYLPKYYAMIASAERLMEIENFHQDTDDQACSSDEVRDFYNQDLRAFGLQNAEFTYLPSVERMEDLSKANMPIVLSDISLRINKGEYVAFTGHSGSGKSTILKLLMSVYQLDKGKRYYVDSEGEHPLTAKYRRLFAYVPQGNQLMSGTIRDIVSFADPSGREDDARLERALSIACAKEFVYDLENGIDTLLGERGTGLSEGQMQRIAIARAIFADCPVVLLDEATSALDEGTESKLLINLRSLTDKTVVIVTHRPAALEICDRILEFDGEGVKEKKKPER